MVNRRSIAQLSDVHTRPPSCCLQLYFAEDENQDHGDGDAYHDGDYDHLPSCCLQLYFADEDQDHGDQIGDDDHGHGIAVPHPPAYN